MNDNLQIEAKQVRLRLTGEKEILDAARQRGSLKKKKDGSEEYRVLFDSVEFVFSIDKKGNRNTVTVGESVARALRSDSRVVVGNDMTGEFVPLIESTAIYSVTQGLPENVCQFCGHDAEDQKDLARHMRDDCAKIRELTARDEPPALDEPPETAMQERVRNFRSTKVPVHENSPAGVR